MKPLPPDEVFRIHANFCTTISNEKRLKIMWLLGENGEMSVGELTEATGLSMANVSQHLRIMRSLNAVQTRKDKQTVYYRITNMTLFEGCKLIHQGLIEQQIIRSELFRSSKQEEESTPDSSTKE